MVTNIQTSREVEKERALWTREIKKIHWKGRKGMRIEWDLDNEKKGWWKGYIRQAALLCVVCGQHSLYIYHIPTNYLMCCSLGEWCAYTSRSVEVFEDRMWYLYEDIGYFWQKISRKNWCKIPWVAQSSKKGGTEKMVCV